MAACPGRARRPGHALANAPGTGARRWGLGHDPIPGTGTAIGFLFVGLGGCGLLLLIVRAAVKIGRQLRAARFDYWDT